jgi:hypothetical protein
MYLENKMKNRIDERNKSLKFILSVVDWCLRLDGFSIGGTNSFSRFAFLRCIDTSVFLSNLAWWLVDFFWRRSASRAKYSPVSSSLSI